MRAGGDRVWWMRRSRLFKLLNDLWEEAGSFGGDKPGDGVGTLRCEHRGWQLRKA